MFNNQAAEFQKKMDTIREHIDSLPGITLGETQQKQLFEQKQNILQQKQ